jgi:hypothetical protein
MVNLNCNSTFSPFASVPAQRIKAVTNATSSVRGANAIIALRGSKLSGRFQDFWGAVRIKGEPN